MKLLTAPLAYFGGKRDLAPQIVPHFGEHDTYYTLFAGSLAELFAKPPARQEVASDKNPDVINLLRCLSFEETARVLWSVADRAPLSETLYHETAARLAQPFERGSIHCGRACDFLLCSWQGPSGIAGTTQKPRFAKRNTASGGSTAARWRAVAGSIPAWHERLQNVEFRCADAFDLLEAAPDRAGVTIYADPPYHPDSRTGGRYAFDFDGPEPHVRLAEFLRVFTRARVVVSYRACDATDQLYDGWRRVALTAPKRMANIRGGEQEVTSADEVLYVNQPE